MYQKLKINSGLNKMQIFPMEQSGRRCPSAHMTALLLVIFQRPHTNFLHCLPRVWPISPSSKVAPHHIHNGKKKKKQEEGRTGKGGTCLPLKSWLKIALKTHSRLISRALLIWPHLTAREVGKCHLYLCDRIPGFCLCESDGEVVIEGWLTAMMNRFGWSHWKAEVAP